MRTIIFFVCLVSMTAAFAAEVKTLCPFMKEQNERINPKAQKPAISVNLKKSARQI